MNKIYGSKNKEKYMEFTKELYNHEALKKDNFKLLQDSKNNKNIIEKEVLRNSKNRKRCID